MTFFQKAILAFLALAAVALFALVFWLYSGAWNKPLGPSLQIPTATPFQMPPTWTPQSMSAGLSLPSTIGTDPSSPFPTSASSPVTVPASTDPAIMGRCGGPPMMTILAVGADVRGNNYDYGLADAIRLVRIDFVNPRITVLEFPRDLWVEIPDIADNLHGQDHEKLNQAYLYGNPGFGYTNDPTQGPGLLARTLALNFGTSIDHYAAVNMRTFEKIVNAVGGIDVNLPSAVDGRSGEDQNPRLLFKQGRHHLDGPSALMLARIRIKGTFARADNQNRVLCALRDKLTSPQIITKVPQLIDSFQGAIQTDLTPAQLGQLACIGTQMNPGNIVFTSFPLEYFKASRTYDPVFKGRVFTWDVDFEILRGYVTQFNQGTWPASSSSSTPDSTPSNEGAIPFCP